MRPVKRLEPTPRARALLLVVAAGASALICAAVWAVLPKALSVHTDIVGYPEAANFNIERYFWAYGLVAGLFPFLALGLYLLLRRTVAPGEARPLGLIELLDRRAPAATGDRVSLATTAGSIILVGLALGFEAAIGGGWQDYGGIVVAAGATAYGLVVALLAVAATAGPLRTWELESVLAAVNALLATAVILGLAWVSSGTQVTVSADGSVHHYPWFPWWLGAVLTLFAVAVVVRTLRRTADAGLIERWVLICTVAPVLLFLFIAFLPGAPGSVDSFHEGEQLGAAQLTADGRFPWRGLLTIHGLLGDVLQPLLNMHVFGHTRWGNLAGDAVIARPATWVVLFLLCAYLFRDNWLFLLGTQVAIVTGWIFAVQSRLLFVPLIILLLALLLRRSTWPRAIAFGTLLLGQVLLTPEGSYMLPAYLAGLVLYEVVHRSGFTRTIRTAVVLGTLGLVFLVVLVTQHAVDDFVFYYRTFAPDHELTGGLTVALGEGEAPTLFGGHLYYLFAAAAPVLLVLLSIWYFTARAPRARAIPVDDWVMGATAIFVGLYYVKFISRTDHVYQTLAVSLPLLFYAIYRAVSACEAWLADRRSQYVPPRHAVTLPLLVILLLAAPTGLVTLARNVPSRLATFAPLEEPTPRIGYVLNRDPLFNSVAPVKPKEAGPGLVSDVRQVVDRYVRPGEPIFDFSNNPGLFWFVLGLPSATRYYHVSMAIRQATQHDLLRELRKANPRVVVYGSEWLGLPFWDGISNEVRHYDVSRYLLDHYRPLAFTHGFLFFARDDTSLPKAPNDLYFRTFPCDWGYTPDFLTIHPQTEAGAVTLHPRNGVLEVPADAKRYGWLELIGNPKLARGIFELSDLPAGGDDRHTIRLWTRGGERSVRIQIGSCSQWHGYASRHLYLRATPAQELRTVRLVP